MLCVSINILLDRFHTIEYLFNLGESTPCITYEDSRSKNRTEKSSRFSFFVHEDKHWSHTFCIQKWKCTVRASVEGTMFTLRFHNLAVTCHLKCVTVTWKPTALHLGQCSAKVSVQWVGCMQTCLADRGFHRTSIALGLHGDSIIYLFI